MLLKSEYTALFGEPLQDDLERTNCKEVGVRHFNCGICPAHCLPRFKCGCINAACLVKEKSE